MYFVGGMHSQSTIEDADDSGINYGVAVMPSGVSDGKEINIQFATGYAITKTAQNPDAAWQFLKESAYANDDMAKATCASGMTSSKKVADDYYANLTYGDKDFSNKIFVDHMGANPPVPLRRHAGLRRRHLGHHGFRYHRRQSGSRRYAGRIRAARSRGIRLLLLQHRSKRELVTPTADAKGSPNFPLRLPIKRKSGVSL